MKAELTTIIAAVMLAVNASADSGQTAQSINTFGLDLHLRLAAEGGNAVTSPWSIQTALAMTYGGAAGKTREEMAKTLHFGGDEAALHAGFAALAKDLADIARQSQAQVKQANRQGGPSTPLEINAANRLFGQESYAFKKPFLNLLKDTYGAPLELMDFKTAFEPSRVRINDWVAGQTKDRIKDLIPKGVLTEDTRLVLANAIYMKAAWQEEFAKQKESPFFLDGRKEIKVPGLVNEHYYGYLKIPGGTIVAVPYADGGLQFLIMVPDEKDGLAAMEKSLTPEILQKAASANTRDIRLYFPKFKLEPDSIRLANHLVAMGMPTAFDKPPQSADFSRMAPRNLERNDYLVISDVIHKAYIAVDEYGTEAAAATAVVMIMPTSAPVIEDKPLEIRADRPFAFAIQHRKSGACLFLGRVTNPR